MVKQNLIPQNILKTSGKNESSCVISKDEWDMYCSFSVEMY